MHWVGFYFAKHRNSLLSSEEESHDTIAFFRVFSYFEHITAL